MQPYRIEPIKPSDQEHIAALLERLWGSRHVVTRGKIFDAAQLPGFVALHNDNIIGLITIRFEATECEVVTLDAFEQGKGIGSALFKAAKSACQSRGCERLWLITTNNNLGAIAFYQKLGMRMIAIHPDAVTEARTLKPQIPLVDENGLPIRDEIEFELLLPAPGK